MPHVTCDMLQSYISLLDSFAVNSKVKSHKKKVNRNFINFFFGN